MGPGTKSKNSPISLLIKILTLNGPIIYDWVNRNNFSIIAPLQPTYFSDSYNLNATLDFAVVKNISAAEAVAINALPSEHNPVWYEFLLSNVLPIPLRYLTTTNWNRFQEISSRTISGNPSINNIRDIEEALAKFGCGINIAINLSSQTRSINTTHHKLPPFITNKITRRNNIRKRWQYTRYPPFKTESNKLTAEIKNDIETWDNNKWKELLQGLNTEDISLYNMDRKLTKNTSAFHPFLGQEDRSSPAQIKQMFSEMLRKNTSRKTPSLMMTTLLKVLKMKLKISSVQTTTQALHLFLPLLRS
ncbi:hypothetical protein AVEN_251657-1 [Araneus ventricosus]|nr:hypothetical protein AVEN_251657-1 [Araneus ventricosus]